MINHYTPATIEQLVKNNQMFRENYLWEAYGDHEGLKADHTRKRLMFKSPLRASSCIGKFQKQLNSTCIIPVENNGTLSP